MRLSLGNAYMMKNKSYHYFCKILWVHGTPILYSLVPNYKSLQESWRVKPSQSLTKIIERNIKIYDIKYVRYENIANKESNDT